MLRPFVLRLILLSIALAVCTSEEPSASWTQSFDSLADYEVAQTVQVRSDIQCVTLASRLALAQLATFDAETRVCKAFRCRLGLQHCKKCRNVHRGNQAVWTASTACWTTIQHRMSSSTSFHRHYDDYKKMFGKGENDNFWIGLRTMYQLTSAGPQRQLRILMRLWNGSQSWAQYASFSVNNESNDFRLLVSGFTGSPGVGDDLSAAQNYRFCARDGPAGDSEKQCARDSSGAWWLEGDDCPGGHLNGQYQNSADARNNGKGVIWTKPFGPDYSLKEAEMLLL